MPMPIPADNRARNTQTPKHYCTSPTNNRLVMGGLAFASGPDPLHTPRMPPNVYYEVRERCHAVLRALFLCVATPIEAPGKRDHGDVDVLVALERRAIFPRTPADQAPRSVQQIREEIRVALRAERVIHQGASANMAIPWPEDLDGPAAEDGVMGDAGADTRRRYIQVDVQICPDVAHLQWHLFKHAHGDFWSLLGSTIRPFGLTTDEEALWLRIPEIEAHNRKKAKIFLTSDPVEILHFLGMEVADKWDAPFASVDDLFDYVATCRLFWVGGAEDEDGEDGAGGLGGEAGLTKLKANDRRRVYHRPNVRRWFNEYIPRCRAEGRHGSTPHGLLGNNQPYDDDTDNNDSAIDTNATDVPPPSPRRREVQRMRAILRAEALQRFPAAAPAYAQRQHAWRREQQEAVVRRDVIDAEIPPVERLAHQGRDAASWRSCAAAAMRKVVLFGDESYGVALPRPPNPPLRLPADDPLALGYDGGPGLFDLDATRRFVRAHWESVGAAAWRRQLERAAEAMLKKRKL